MTRSRGFISVVALALAVVLFGTSTERAMSAEPIVAGTLTSTPPMMSFAGDGTTMQGVFVDLAAAMSKEMGRQIVFKSMPFPGLLPAMQAKRIDIAFTLMNDTPEREKVVDFVDFYNLGTKLLVRKGNPDKIDGLDSLCGKAVSTVQGSVQLALVDEANKKCASDGKPAIQNFQYAQPSDARMQLQTGRVAAFLGNSPILVYLAHTAGDGKLFEVVDKDYAPAPIGIAVAKDNVALRDSLQNALNQLIKNGTYRKILQQYGVESGAVTTATINGAH